MRYQEHRGIAFWSAPSSWNAKRTLWILVQSSGARAGASRYAATASANLPHRHQFRLRKSEWPRSACAAEQVSGASWRPAARPHERRLSNPRRSSPCSGSLAGGRPGPPQAQHPAGGGIAPEDRQTAYQRPAVVEEEERCAALLARMQTLPTNDVARLLTCERKPAASRAAASRKGSPHISIGCHVREERAVTYRDSRPSSRSPDGRRRGADVTMHFAPPVRHRLRVQRSCGIPAVEISGRRSVPKPEQTTAKMIVEATPAPIS
jgi:hypothetical protein